MNSNSKINYPSFFAPKVRERKNVGGRRVEGEKGEGGRRVKGSKEGDGSGKKGGVRNNGVNIFCFYSRKKVTCCLPEEGERERERGGRENRLEREAGKEKNWRGKMLSINKCVVKLPLN